jgi:3-dehydroquinate dehydratase II
MKSVRRKAAATAGKLGWGPDNLCVLDGPYQGLAGTRESAFIGLADTNRRLKTRAEMAGVGEQTSKSDYEGALTDRVRAAHNDGAGFIVMNSAGFTTAESPQMTRGRSIVWEDRPAWTCAS